ncbi:Protein BONZAI 2 [Linum perenne]
MGNCFSDEVGGRSAVGGTGASSAGAGANDAVDQLLRYRGFHGLFSQIELSFSATNLRDRDMISKFLNLEVYLLQSDPMVVVYTKGRDGALTEAFRTEVILNSLNPSWIAKCTVTFQFEIVQTLVFRVYDIDTQFHNVDVKMLKLEEQQFLGEASSILSKIVTKPDRTLTLNLVQIEDPSHPKSCGQLIVHAEECINSKTCTEMTLRCSDLENKDLFSKSDSPLLVQCFNFNNNGKHDLIGRQAQNSLAEFEKRCSSKEGINLVLPAVGHNQSTKKVLKGQLFVDKLLESTQHTFLDYLRGGYELNFMVAVDFTASNGNPRLPDSLHYIDPSHNMDLSTRPNAYQKAILEVGEVLKFYDSDQRFPAWGFGARPIDGPVSHCFNLNGSKYNHEVEGLHGILIAYSNALYNVSLAGPTLFGHVITKAASIARSSLENGERKYFVLLIITDGVVTDLQETKDAIVQASDLPFSILIVGVGGADFREMEILDGDKGERLESSTSRVATRDIVQFVPMRDVENGEMSVVQGLLAELPTQFLAYMRSRNLEP